MRLPLADSEGATPASYEGRRHLAGAFLIRVDRIRPDPAQPRRLINQPALDELAASVRQWGILQPITVRYVEVDDIYQIITGERRYHAARAIGLTELPCWVRTPETDVILIHQIIENWQRAELQPFEIADSLAQLRDAKQCTQRELAAAVGKSEGEVSKLLKLLALSPAVQEQARRDQTGVLSRRHLYAMSRLEPEEQAVIATAVREQYLSASDTEQFVTRRLASRTGPKRGAPVTRVQLVTPTATVVLTFRRQSVSTADILAALDAAKAKALEIAEPLNIVRPK